MWLVAWLVLTGSDLHDVFTAGSFPLSLETRIVQLLALMYVTQSHIALRVERRLSSRSSCSWYEPLRIEIHLELWY